MTYAGLVGMLVGVLDPLEGSVAIIAGSAVVALAAFIARSPYRWRMCAALGLMVLGVVMMWLLSAMGGVGGASRRSNWWGMLLLPYPVGWVIGLVAVFRMIRQDFTGGGTR
jgi:hypothetical protein